MKYKLIIIIPFLTCILSLHSEEAVESKKERVWSAYLGKMNWSDAKAKCASIKKRLPTRSELENAYKSGIMESWKSDGNVYWSSEGYSSAYAYFFYISPMALSPSHSAVITFTKHVRCIAQ